MCVRLLPPLQPRLLLQRRLLQLQQPPQLQQQQPRSSATQVLAPLRAPAAVQLALTWSPVTRHAKRLQTHWTQSLQTVTWGTANIYKLSICQDVLFLPGKNCISTLVVETLLTQAPMCVR